MRQIACSENRQHIDVLKEGDLPDVHTQWTHEVLQNPNFSNNPHAAALFVAIHDGLDLDFLFLSRVGLRELKSPNHVNNRLSHNQNISSCVLLWDDCETDPYSSGIIFLMALCGHDCESDSKTCNTIVHLITESMNIVALSICLMNKSSKAGIFH